MISVKYFTCLKFCCHLCEGEESKLFSNAGVKVVQWVVGRELHADAGASESNSHYHMLAG